MLRDRLLIVQGKAAIDVVCNPLGKSGGSAIQQVMIIAFGSLSASTPYLGAILLAVVLVWMGAARSLNVQVRCACCVHALSWGLAPCLSPRHANAMRQSHGGSHPSCGRCHGRLLCCSWRLTRVACRLALCDHCMGLQCCLLQGYGMLFSCMEHLEHEGSFMIT